jgi:cytochrome c oxidase cbb3-type subunit III
MNRRRACGCVLAGIALWAGVVSVQAAGQGRQGAPGQGGGGGRAGGAPPGGQGGGGQGGFVAYPQRPVSDPTAVDRGKALFSVNCAFCHGPDARGGDNGGPNLMRSDVVLLDDKGERIGSVVLGGRADKGMPPFMLMPAQISDIAAFLHSLPVSSRTGERQVNIVVGNADVGRSLFQAKCSSCHSPTGDLQGVANRFTDPKLLQQTWLLPGTGGTRGGGPPVTAPPIGAVVTLANGQKVEGTLNRIDDFMVSLRLADGTYRTFRTEGANAPKVELRDPLKGHRDLLLTYSDDDIHNITAFLVTLK